MTASLLTPERHQYIIDKLAAGHDPERVAKAAGISIRTYYNWLERGQHDQDQPLNPDNYSMPQLRKLAATQGADETLITGRITKAKLAQLLHTPTPHLQFLHDVTRALPQAEMATLEMAEAAGKDDWRFHAWKLERRWPERWGQVRDARMPEAEAGAGVVSAEASLEAGKVRLKVIDGGQQ